MPINERLNLSVSFGGAVKATATTTIIDTSLPAYEYILVGTNPSSTEIYQSDAPTYLLSSNVSTVNEGDAITFTLNTTMLDTGTVIPYTITGVSVSDISLSTLTGNFVTDAAGKATLSFNIINDIATEGNETLILTLNALNVSKSVIINDTSMMPTYVAGWYGNSTGTTGVLSSVDEGQHAYLVVKTTNVPNGTVLNVTLTGGINVADLAEVSLSTTITVTNNIAYRLYNTKIDETTEGNELVKANVYLNSTLVSTANLTINDTSITPPIITIIPTGGVVDGTYKVIRGFNLADEFIKVMGRAPAASEDIVLEVPVNWALVGNDASTPGITIDNRFNTVSSITITNQGLIAGKGGNGAGGDSSGGRFLRPTDGGTGIKNTSTLNIVVNNSSIIGGGGGGSGTNGVYVQDVVFGGDGGIPYGYTHRGGFVGYKGLPAGPDPAQTSGGLGMNGAKGSANWGEYFGFGGFIKEGLVTINNINGGITRGR